MTVEKLLELFVRENVQFINIIDKQCFFHYNHNLKAPLKKEV